MWYYVDMKKSIAEKLHSHGLRVTPQRLWVYEYLKKYKTHPDAEEVYNAIKENESGITLSTVYNVLQAFTEKGLAVTVNLDGERTRFDANVELHGHFRCSKCNSICDFEVNNLEYTGLEGFEISLKDVYFGGLCNKCNNKKHN